MSVSFVSTQVIDYSELKSFSFKGVWVDEIDAYENILLTDGANYLWCYRCNESESTVSDESKSNYCNVLFTRYAFNEVEKIMEALKEYFKISFIFESDERFEQIIGETD